MQIHTIVFRSIETIAAMVQIHIATGLPAMADVGPALLPKWIAVNLALADVLKEGAHFDLLLALGLMVAMGLVPRDAVEDALVLGVPARAFSRAPACGQKYQAKISGLVMDPFDLIIEVPKISAGVLPKKASGESS